MSASADLALLVRARAGDARAVEQLLARHELRIYRYGMRMCGNEADARDVLQETLLAAFQSACAAIEAHLGTCPRCAAACEALQRTVALCRGLPGGEVPAPVKAAVRAALRRSAVG